MAKRKVNRPEASNEPLPESIKFSELDDLSQEVFTHFGIEAPALLNKYSIALEDALIEQCRRVDKNNAEIKRLRALLEEHNIAH